MKFLSLLLILCGLTNLASASGVEDPKLVDPSIMPPAWSPEMIATWESLPIRDGGRVKPLYTFAYYELLRTRSLPSLTVKFTKPDPVTGKNSRSYTPTAWLLDCLFYPEAAKQYFCFTIDDGEALRRVGLTPHPMKRDQYSYNELVVARDRLAQLQDDVDRKKELAKTNQTEPTFDHLDEMAANLAKNVGAFEALIQAAAPLRRALPIASTLPDGPLSDQKGKSISTSTALSAVKANPLWNQIMKRFEGDANEAMMNLVGMLRESEAWKTNGPRSFGEIDKFGPALEAYMKENETTLKAQPNLASIFNVAPFLMLDMRASGPRVSMVPPFGGADKNWHSFGDLAQMVLNPAASPEAQAGALERLQQGEQALAQTDNASREKALIQFAQSLHAAGKDLPAVATVGTELTFRKWDFLNKAKWAFLLIFVFVAITWLAPQASWASGLFAVCKWAMWLPLSAIVVAIGYRVEIGFGAPVTNLYETIPVITFVAAGLAVLAELIFRTRLALGVGALMGCLGMFLAGGFEASEATDTIHSLEAVLRTGVWLWTHVMCEAIAYGAAVIGGVFSIVYIFARLFDLERRKADFFKMLTSCAYGILCFTLIFILVGTVLGGIWGNQSWGRFWGWDPKENGALVITLWCLAVLHMRLAGWIKEIGLHIMSVLGIGGIIFSWWHVNELGVGLHAYGRTEGRMPWIISGYCAVLLIALLGATIAYVTRNGPKSAAPKKAEPLLPAEPSLQAY